MSEQKYAFSTCLMGEWMVVASAQTLLETLHLETVVDRHAIRLRYTENSVKVDWIKSDLPFNIHAQIAYGFVWICVGEPKKPLFQLEEYAIPQARLVPCGAYGVRTSPLRAIENFLDMAHFPYVHTGILGAEPETMVKPYQVEYRKAIDEIWATECFFTQPLAAPSSSQPQETEYIYRVATPLNAILYKVNTQAEGIIPADVICLFIQPINETQIRAHLLMILDDQISSMTDMVLFQQKIFTQDKPILENHLPLKLPLHQRIEIPTKADALATAYRKWLLEKQWSYGVFSPEKEHVV